MISAKEAFNMAENSKEVSTKLDSIYEAIEAIASQGGYHIHHSLDKGDDALILTILSRDGYDLTLVADHGYTYEYRISWSSDPDNEEEGD